MYIITPLPITPGVPLISVKSQAVKYHFPKIFIYRRFLSLPGTHYKAVADSFRTWYSKWNGRMDDGHFGQTPWFVLHKNLNVGIWSCSELKNYMSIFYKSKESHSKYHHTLPCRLSKRHQCQNHSKAEAPRWNNLRSP